MTLANSAHLEIIDGINHIDEIHEWSEEGQNPAGSEWKEIPDEGWEQQQEDWNPEK